MAGQWDTQAKVYAHVSLVVKVYSVGYIGSHLYSRQLGYWCIYVFLSVACPSPLLLLVACLLTPDKTVHKG